MLHPHSVSNFDPFQNLTRQDVRLTKKYMRISIKWLKTIQTRDRLHIIILLRMRPSNVCPVKALQNILVLYNPSPQILTPVVGKSLLIQG